VKPDRPSPRAGASPIIDESAAVKTAWTETVEIIEVEADSAADRLCPIVAETRESDAATEFAMP